MKKVVKDDNLKVIENKLTEIPFNEERKANYADLIKSLIDLPMSKEGITMDTMRKNFHILDIVEKRHDEKTLEFSESQLDLIKSNLANSVWTIQHKDLVLFADHIDSIN